MGPSTPIITNLPLCYYPYRRVFDPAAVAVVEAVSQRTAPVQVDTRALTLAYRHGSWPDDALDGERLAAGLDADAEVHGSSLGTNHDVPVPSPREPIAAGYCARISSISPYGRVRALGAERDVASDVRVLVAGHHSLNNWFVRAVFAETCCTPEGYRVVIASTLGPSRRSACALGSFSGMISRSVMNASDAGHPRSISR